MSEKPDYGPALDDEDLEVHAENMSWSFRIPRDFFPTFYERVGRDKFRVLRHRGRPVAGLSLFPLGQWYGGRRLEMTGVNLVGVAPEHRGAGAATHLMEAAVREMRDAGTPISVLYPAKQTLYRRAGYELAGSRFHIEVDLKDLDVGERELRVRPAEESDREAVDATYRAFAAEHTGLIDRPPFMWRRIVDPPDQEVRGFLVEGEEGIEGYLYALETAGENFRFNLDVKDFVARTGRAGRRLLRLLADHGTLADRASWFGNPADASLVLLPEQNWRTRVFFHWMLRILDPVIALERRGYPEGLRAAVELEIEDPMLPENDGRYRLEVENGRGRVTRGGAGTIRTSIRGLAAVYSGFLTPAVASRAGLLSGEARALRVLQGVFAGPIPWMSDMF